MNAEHATDGPWAPHTFLFADVDTTGAAPMNTTFPRYDTRTGNHPAMAPDRFPRNTSKAVTQLLAVLVSVLVVLVMDDAAFAAFTRALGSDVTTTNLDILRAMISPWTWPTFGVAAMCYVVVLLLGRGPKPTVLRSHDRRLQGGFLAFAAALTLLTGFAVVHQAAATGRDLARGSYDGQTLRPLIRPACLDSTTSNGSPASAWVIGVVDTSSATVLVADRAGTLHHLPRHRVHAVACPR